MSNTSTDVLKSKQNNERGFQSEPKAARDGVKCWNSFQNGDDGGEGDEEGSEDMNKECCLRGCGLFQEHVKVLVPRGLHVLELVRMVVPQVLGIVGTVERCIIGGRGSCCR